MASKNPLAGSFIADNEMPQAEPHHRAMGMKSHPMEMHKVRAKGRPVVEMPRGHGARMSAAGRDMHTSSSRGAKLPGMKEPSGIQAIPGGNRATVVGPRVPNVNMMKGSMNSQRHVNVRGNRSFGGMGKGMSDKAMGPVKPVR